MASSSSAKKVARVAAKSGSGSPVGAASVKQRNWLFALAIVAIVGGCPATTAAATDSWARKDRVLAASMCA